MERYINIMCKFFTNLTFFGNIFYSSLLRLQGGVVAIASNISVIGFVSRIVYMSFQVSNLRGGWGKAPAFPSSQAASPPCDSSQQETSRRHLSASWPRVGQPAPASPALSQCWFPYKALLHRTLSAPVD